MRQLQPPPRDFDLPVIHLGEEGHYAPDQAVDEEEIARRQTLPWGVLIAEEQEAGLQVAANVLYVVEEPKSIEFSARFIAASGLNTAWYSFARNAEDQVMRRRLKLPLLTADRPDWRPTSDQLRHNAAEDYQYAVGGAHKVVKAFERHSPRTVEFNTKFGRAVGNASLLLAAMNVGDLVHNDPAYTDHQVQVEVRKRGLKALNDGRDLIDELQVYPSIAQLINPDSELSVYWRRHAPAEARAALILSTEAVQAQEVPPRGAGQLSLQV